MGNAVKCKASPILILMLTMKGHQWFDALFLQEVVNKGLICIWPRDFVAILCKLVFASVFTGIY